MKAYQFSVAKEKVYRGYRPGNFFSFKEWFEEVYLAKGKRYLIAVREEKNIRFGIMVDEKFEKSAVADFLKSVIMDYKRELAENLKADYRMFYLDPQHKKHKETKEFLEASLFDKEGNSKASLYYVLNEMGKDIMKFEPLVKVEESHSEEPKEEVIATLEPEDEDMIEIDMDDGEEDIEGDEGIEIPDFDEFDIDGIM